MNNDAKQVIAGIAVAELFTRFEVKRELLESPDHLVMRQIVAHEKSIRRQIGKALNPGSVLQQIPYRDHMILRWIIWEILGNTII